MKLISVCLSYTDSMIRKIRLNRSLLSIKLRKESFVIMFHDVSFSNENKDKYGINIDDFVKTINYILELGYKFIHLEDFKRIGNQKNGYCVLTFDDGFYSTYRLMKEYLIIKDIPFHMFAVSDWIGKEGYVTTAQLIEMSNESICEIGSHSCTHPRFRDLKTNEAVGELHKSKMKIEEIIKKEIHEFAFPFGSQYACSDKHFKEAVKVGYNCVYSTDPLTLKKMKDLYKIPRINGLEIFKRI